MVVGTTLAPMAAICWFAWQQEAGWGEKALPTLVLVLVALLVNAGAIAWLASVWRDHDLRTYREVVDYVGGRNVRRDGAASKLARGNIGEKVVHFLPYLAVIAVVGYVLGRLVKLALVALGWA